MSLTKVKGAVFESADNNLAVNVKDAPYNASGNGVDDDTAAIQAALTTGSVIHFPEGIYLISSPIVLSSGVSPSIIGDGVGRSVLKFTDSLVTDHMIEWNSASDFIVRDIEIDFNNVTMFDSSTKKGGLGFIGCDDFKVIRVDVTSITSMGVGINGCRDYVLEDMYIEMNTALNTFNQAINTSSSLRLDERGTYRRITGMRTGININSKNSLVDDCRFYDIKFGGGVVMTPYTGCGWNKITNCYASGGLGIDANTSAVKGFEISCEQATIIGNTAVNNAGQGFVIASEGAIIVGNYADGNGAEASATGGEKDGFHLRDLSAANPTVDGLLTQNAVFTGNVSTDTKGTKTQLYGIRLGANVTNVSEVGNYLNGNSSGVRASTADDNYIYLDSNGVFQSSTQEPQKFNMGRTTQVISSGAITAESSFMLVDTEASAATDDLTTINGGVDGMRIVLQSLVGTRDTTVVNSASLQLAGGADFVLDSTHDTIELIYNSSSASWNELSRSNNT